MGHLVSLLAGRAIGTVLVPAARASRVGIRGTRSVSVAHEQNRSRVTLTIYVGRK